MINKTKEELINFENWTVETFNSGKLRSPVHLSGGNEEQLIEIFKEINPEDCCFTTYRSHYHALLKGVPEERLKDWILQNKSIHFMDKEYKVFSSAIVGGTLPIALGVAMAIKKKNEKYKVWCFIGDMTASLGVFKDCLAYAVNFDLPITFVIEDNGLSTDTVTNEVWNCDISKRHEELSKQYPKFVRYYKYKRVWPHYGTNRFISSIWSDIIKENDVKNKGF